MNINERELMTDPLARLSELLGEDAANRIASTLSGLLAEDLPAPKEMRQSPPETQVKKESLHDWSHYIARMIGDNISTVMARTNLLDFLTDGADLAPVRVQVQCVMASEVTYPGFVMHADTGEGTEQIWKLTFVFGPQ